MVRTCTHCGTAKFGLIRYRKGNHVFCKRSCKAAWEHEEKQYLKAVGAAQKRFFAYLAREPT